MYMLFPRWHECSRVFWLIIVNQIPPKKNTNRGCAFYYISFVQFSSNEINKLVGMYNRQYYGWRDDALLAYALCSMKFLHIQTHQQQCFRYATTWASSGQLLLALLNVAHLLIFICLKLIFFPYDLSLLNVFSTVSPRGRDISSLTVCLCSFNRIHLWAWISIELDARDW